MPKPTTPTTPKPIYLSGGSLYGRGYMRSSEPDITLDDLRRAIDAHGGNQTAFAREVLGFKDGRQVRRYLAGSRMAWEPARKLAAHLKETQGTLNMFAKGKRSAK